MAPTSAARVPQIHNMGTIPTEPSWLQIVIDVLASLLAAMARVALAVIPLR